MWLNSLLKKFKQLLSGLCTYLAMLVRLSSRNWAEAHTPLWTFSLSNREQKYADSRLFCYSSRAQTKNSSQINSDVKVESATMNLLLWKWGLLDKRNNCRAYPTPRQVSGALLGTKTNWVIKRMTLLHIGLVSLGALYSSLMFPIMPKPIINAW